MGLDAVDQALQLGQVTGIDPAGSAEAETHTVQAHRPMVADRFQLCSGAAAAHVVFRVDFNPGKSRTGGHDLCDVRHSQADAAPGGGCSLGEGE